VCLVVEAATPRVRCAIYTRKSTDEGLEQNFNSLHAQREACEAYAASQRHEGWEVLPGLYDDGGYSGGTLDRPALKQLLSEVSAGRVDVIIIYKIDRLTRSLSDFARIVDVLDRAQASFVSITQSFNTTSSMGRLTLNMLLSFAQFEREVGAERVRDKIAASKRKGMWMGGVCPLGYDVKDRALIVNEDEARSVRSIFDRYLKLGSVRALEAGLRSEGVVSKRRTSRAGRITGGLPFSRGALYVMLRNRTYIGQVSHGGKVFPGQQAAILNHDNFERAQCLLNANGVKKRGGPRDDSSPLLAGVIWDGEGRPMTPTHTKKGTKRYRYYKTRDPAGDLKDIVRVSAGELESLVLARLRAFLLDASSIHDALLGLSLDAGTLQQSLDRARAIANRLEITSDSIAADTNGAIVRVDVRVDTISVRVDLGELFLPGHPGAVVDLSVPSKIVRRTREVRLVIPSGQERQGRQDPGLIKLLVRAREVRNAFENSGQASLAELAKGLGYQPDYCGVLLKLGYLAPKVVQMILEGTHPASMTRQYLARMRALPIIWSDQILSLGAAEQVPFR
jgi:site-specific DNA recombinase